jgi:hypothetical protein
VELVERLRSIYEFDPDVLSDEEQSRREKREWGWDKVSGTVGIRCPEPKRRFPLVFPFATPDTFG